MEIAHDMRNSGILTKAAHEKMTMRHADVAPMRPREP